MRNLELNRSRRPTHRGVAWPVLCPLSVGRGRSSGFTLVEMMVVVVIISILSTLAIVGFRKLRQSSHVSEATNMVQNIRVAQEGYHSETQQYANITKTFPSGSSPSGGLYPAPSGTPMFDVMTGWGGACNGCNSGIDWSVLPLHVDAPVLFGYATIAGGPGGTFAPGTVYVNGTGMAVNAPAATDWYGVAAEADLDGNTSTVTDVFSFSWSNQLFISNEGL
jgi:prepilin-type N-terminal cleavage/methylation domain-containing protein